MGAREQSDVSGEEMRRVWVCAYFVPTACVTVPTACATVPTPGATVPTPGLPPAWTGDALAHPPASDANANAVELLVDRRLRPVLTHSFSSKVARGLAQGGWLARGWAREV